MVGVGPDGWQTVDSRELEAGTSREHLPARCRRDDRCKQTPVECSFIELRNVVGLLPSLSWTEEVDLQSLRRSWVRCPWVVTPQSLKGFIKALLKSLSVLEVLDGSCDWVLVVMSEIFGSVALVWRKHSLFETWAHCSLKRTKIVLIYILLRHMIYFVLHLLYNICSIKMHFSTSTYY